jgi:hypothetical protein
VNRRVRGIAKTTIRRCVQQSQPSIRPFGTRAERSRTFRRIQVLTLCLRSEVRVPIRVSFVGYWNGAETEKRLVLVYTDPIADRK